LNKYGNFCAEQVFCVKDEAGKCACFNLSGLTRNHHVVSSVASRAYFYVYREPQNLPNSLFAKMPNDVDSLGGVLLVKHAVNYTVLNLVYAHSLDKVKGLLNLNGIQHNGKWLLG
jgi:hypothetical protein